MRYAAVLLAALAIALTGCGSGRSHAEQVKTCDQYLSARFRHYMKDPSGTPPLRHRPAQCDGVTGAELKRIVGRILARQLNG